MIKLSNQTNKDNLLSEIEQIAGEKKSSIEGPKYTHEAEVTETIKTQAEKIIEKFGGPRILAEALTQVGYPINRVQIYRWTYSKESGGTGGLIPTAAMAFVFPAARLHGVHITAEDMDPRETHEINRRLTARIDNATGVRTPWVLYKDKKALEKKLRLKEKKLAARKK